MRVMLDLFCGAGGAAYGYWAAGFMVVGVDNVRQRRYPFPFLYMDAFDAVEQFGGRVDAIHASPPCQAYSITNRKVQESRRRGRVDLVAQTREALQALGKPYIIENVIGAPLIDPVLLCGTMFGIRTYRHRLFETNFPVDVPLHPKHVARSARLGHAPREGEFLQCVGHFSGLQLALDEFKVPWMSRDEVSQCIPPAYSWWVGKCLLSHMTGAPSEIGVGDGEASSVG